MTNYFYIAIDISLRNIRRKLDFHPVVVELVEVLLRHVLSDFEQRYWDLIATVALSSEEYVLKRTNKQN